MLVAKLEQLSQLKRQLQKEQKVMDEMESQRMSPNGAASLLNKKHLPLGSENTLVKAATAGIQDLPQTLNEIKKRMERDSSGANERLMARLKQKSALLRAAREEELLAQLWVIAESMERVQSPSSTISRSSATPSSPSSDLPPPVSTTPALMRNRRSRRKPPVSIPTLHLIDSFAATPSRPVSPTRPVHAHVAGVPGTSLTLASTFVVVGQPKIITALPSDPAVARLPKHLAQAAARALQPNLQAFQGAWTVALTLAKFNERLRDALAQTKNRFRWQQQQAAQRDKRVDVSRPRTGEWEQRSATPSTAGLGGGRRMATSALVDDLSVEAMEKLSAHAVQQQLLKLEEERAEIEQQAHRLRTESIALHRYFLNRKFNVNKGISLAEAIETSAANVTSWPPFSATFNPSTAAMKEGSKSEAKAIAVARAEVSLIRQASIDAQSSPRAASCLSDVARVFTKHLSAKSPFTPALETIAGGGLPKGMAAKVGGAAAALRPSTSGEAGIKAEGARPKFFVGGRAGFGDDWNKTLFHGQYKDGMTVENILQRPRARDKEISGDFPDLAGSKEADREHEYDKFAGCIIPGTAKPDGRRLLNEMRICMGLNRMSVPLQQLLSREITQGEKAMEVEKNIRRGGGRGPKGKWQMKVSERPWDPPKRKFRAMLKNPM